MQRYEEAIKSQNKNSVFCFYYQTKEALFKKVFVPLQYIFETEEQNN